MYSTAPVDRAIINKKLINSALNCEVKFSFEEVPSDHRIVSTKIFLSLRRNKKQTDMSGPHSQ